LGFGHTRLQTWLPLSATVCINGRHWLERQLLSEQIRYVKEDNCFTWIEDEGVRLKHWVNRNSVKLYNKAGNLLRVETTINNTRDFKVFRHPNDDDSKPASWQQLRKGVSDLHRRAQVSQASNERYLDHLAASSFSATLEETLSAICRSEKRNGRCFRAINPWGTEDFRMLQFLARGEMHVNGFRNRNLRACLEPHLDKGDSPARSRASGRLGG